MTIGILFPGQGSQAVGMGADVFAAMPELGSVALDVLGWDLAAMCLEGTDEDLTRTEHAQPALYVTAYGLWLALRDELGITPAGAAGHSLGEYTALAAAEVFDFATGLGLVARRGIAMADAAAAEPSGMAALIGADPAAAEEICAGRRADGGRLWVANLNAPGQVVVGGAQQDIDWIVANARDAGVRRAIPLKVAGAFHSPLMASAAEELAEALGAVEFADPGFPVWSNVDAAPMTDIVDALRRQVTGTVRFSDSLLSMAADGIDTFIHVGPGDVTAGMARRVVDGATVHVVSSLEEAIDVSRTVTPGQG